MVQDRDVGSSGQLGIDFPSVLSVPCSAQTQLITTDEVQPGSPKFTIIHQPFKGVHGSQWAIYVRVYIHILYMIIILYYIIRYYIIFFHIT